jgi:hypothetical protein
MVPERPGVSCVGEQKCADFSRRGALSAAGSTHMMGAVLAGAVNSDHMHDAKDARVLLTD